VAAGELVLVGLEAADVLAAEGIETRVVQVFDHTALRRHLDGGFITSAQHPTVTLHNAPRDVLASCVGPGRRRVLAADGYGAAASSVAALFAQAGFTSAGVTDAVRGLVT
jgi:transketolase